MPTDIYQLKVGGKPAYIKTGAEAVEGLDEKIDKKLEGAGAGTGTVSSVNGKVGAVMLTAADVEALPANLEVATAIENGLMAKEDKIVLDKLATFEFVKVGEV